MPGPNEATTRRELIDPALQRAGWDLNDPDQVRFEIPVDGTSPQAWSALKVELNRIKEAGGTYHKRLFVIVALANRSQNCPRIGAKFA